MREKQLGLRSYINKMLSEKRSGFLFLHCLLSKPHIKNDAFLYSWNKKSRPYKWS